MKNIEYIITKTANDLDIPREKVKVVIEAYWDSVYKKLLNMESTTVCIRNVGLITVSKFKLRKFILRYIDKIRKTQATPKFTPADKKMILDKQKEKLRKALVQRNIIAKDYYEKFNR